MNLGTDMDTGTVTEIGMATSTASETTTNMDTAMNTGTTTDTDTDMVTNTETHIDTDKETGMVMHGQIHEERTRDHTDSDTFESMVTTPSTGTWRDWNDNGNGQDITDTVTNSVTVMDSDTVTNTDMATRAGILIDSHMRLRATNSFSLWKRLGDGRLNVTLIPWNRATRGTVYAAGRRLDICMS